MVACTPIIQSCEAGQAPSVGRIILFQPGIQLMIHLFTGRARIFLETAKSDDKLIQSCFRLVHCAGAGNTGIKDASMMMKRNHTVLRLAWLLILALLLAACTNLPAIDPDSPRATETLDGTDRLRATDQVTDGPSGATPVATETPTPTSQPTSSLGVDKAELQGVTLQFWHPWTGETEAHMQELVNQFNTTNPYGIFVQARSFLNLDSLHQAVVAALDDGNTPDLVVASAHQILDWDSQEQLAELEPYARDPVWGLADDDLADFYPVFLLHNPADERLLGLPALASGQMLYYNQSWAQELGFEAAPLTPDELREQACRAAQANAQDDLPENDKTGGLILASDYSSILGWIYAFGGTAVNTVDDQVDSPYAFNQPEVEQAFEFLRSLYDQGCAWLPEDPYPEEDFAARRGLFAMGSITGLPYQASLFEQAGSRDQWTVLPFPSSKDTPTVPVYGPSYTLLNSTPERQLAAWLFLANLALPENQARMVESTGAFPARSAAMDYMQEYMRSHPQWAAAVNNLLNARPEPPYSSWRTVRWALSDAASQLFRSYFTIDQVPQLVKFLNDTAADLHKRAALPPGAPPSSQALTPVPTAGTPLTPAPSTTPLP